MSSIQTVTDHLEVALNEAEADGASRADLLNGLAKVAGELIGDVAEEGYERRVADEFVKRVQAAARKPRG